MALQKKLVEELAAKLDASKKSGEQIAHFSSAYPQMTVGDSYAIQREWMAMECAAGRHIIGHKIGLTSRAMQKAVNITEPDYGVLLDDMLLEAGQDIPIARFIEPRVEVELAFILREPLKGPGCTIFDVLNSTDYVVPAIEIIDARIERIDRETGATRKVLDTIADNAANAGIVLGGRPVRPDAIDLRWISAIMYKNGVVEETGVAAGVLNHPANGPAWLANRLSPYGVKLEAGEIILGGSFTAPIFVAQGDTVQVDYGRMGSISMRFI